MGNYEGFANNEVNTTEYLLSTANRPISIFSFMCPGQNSIINDFQNRRRKAKISKSSQRFMTSLGTEHNFKDEHSLQTVLYSMEPSEKLRAPDVLGTLLACFLSEE